MKTEPWQWIILCALAAAIYYFAQDLVVWFGWISAPHRGIKVFFFSLVLAVIGACAVYRFFAWLGSIPAEDPRQKK